MSVIEVGGLETLEQFDAVALPIEAGRAKGGPVRLIDRVRVSIGEVLKDMGRDGGALANKLIPAGLQDGAVGSNDLSAPAPKNV